MEPLLRSRGLAKSFDMAGRSVHVLQDLDFEVERGEMVAITGASGSGKSTLLHILGALDRPSAGSYRFAGQEMMAFDDDQRSRLRATHIGFVFQSFYLLPQHSILENVALPFLYAPRDAGDPHDRAATALERVGLAHRLDHRPAELSGGEVQRAAIARAIVVDPELLLADEPTGNLDSATGAQILDVLEALNAAGTTVVLVTHNAEVAARARRRVNLRDGRFDA
jgi:predicted ABC-type transport system involved in lysophospholipase L1 biosynthesis ATPase subunit